MLILMRRSLVPAVLVALITLSGCTGQPSDTEQTAASPETNANETACTDLAKLWDEVEEWGITPGNTEADGRPTASATAPDFRVKLDEIRQATDGTVRTTLDEYFEETPAQGTWWYANGAHEYGYTHAVGSACEAEGVNIDLR